MMMMMMMMMIIMAVTVTMTLMVTMTMTVTMMITVTIMVTVTMMMMTMLMTMMMSLYQQPMILDAKSDPEKVRALLTRLQARMDALHERSATFKNYQKNFKVSRNHRHPVLYSIY